MAFYFSELPRPRTSKTYPILIQQMKVLGYKENKETKSEDSPFLWRVMDAHRSLVERGLAPIEQDSTGMDVTVALTLKGRDLGAKYDDALVRSGL